MADGSLIFDTKLDSSSFDKGTDKIEKEAEKTSKTVSNEFQQASKSINTTVGSSCDGVVKSLSSMLGAVKGLLVAAGIGVAIKQVASGISATIKKLKSFLESSQTYFKTQFTAEKRLEQVMHNVAGATEEQVQATKDWAAELQKVGVIGDEVTLSGLQELGKYVNDADSLKQLSGAMDDLIAQEHGLDATAENAATTAAMLGKALNGQTAVLRRNGIIFTEAQENVLKYGDEQQRVAVLAQVIESRVGGMNAALANTPAGRLQQLSNTFGDIKEKFGEAYTNLKTLFVPILNQVAGVLAQIASYAVQATQALGEIFGISLDSSLAYKNNIMSATDAQEDLTSAIEDTEKAQKGSLAAFDKLNTISSDKSDKSGAASSMVPSVNTKDSEKSISKFAKKVKDIFAKLKAYFGNTFKGIWDGLKAESEELWQTLKRIWGDIKTLAEPFKNYLQNDFIPFLDTVFGTAGEIAVGLFDTFNKVFSDIWDIVMFPYLQTLTNVALPVVTQFYTELTKTLGVWFNEIKSIFDMLWEDVAKPVLTLMMKIWMDLWTIIKKYWDKYGAVVFEKYRTAIKNTGDVLKKAWETIFQPIFQKLMEAADELWDKHLKGLFDDSLNGIGMIILAGLDLYNDFIIPVAKWFIDIFGPSIANTFKTVITVVAGFVDFCITSAKDALNAFGGIISFLRGTFTGDWELAWIGVRRIFESVFGSLADIIAVPFNLLIGKLNTFLYSVEKIFNTIGNYLDKFNIDVPDWVPTIGGKSFSVDLPDIDLPRIPYLAQGTVIPANYGNFLAMLGDNKRETEVVSPISTMKQAMLEALAEAGGNGPKEITLYTYLYPNSAAFNREVISIVNADAANRGGI